MRTILFSVFFFIPLLIFSQSDPWTGIWKASLKQYRTASPISLEVHIGEPERSVLYPATFKIQYGGFTGLYEVLLARKNDHQLGIGRNKYPLIETPFKLGIWMWYLNGIFDLKNKKITLNRMWIDKFGIWMRGLYEGDEIFTQSKVNIRNFLYQDSITLIQTGNKPLADSSRQRILRKNDKHIYFGIYDPIETSSNSISMELRDSEKYDKDTVTLVHNGRSIFSHQQITDANRKFEVSLDTGRNLFIFFADNYGKLPPNTGFLFAQINNKQYGFDFSDKPNAYATFLVADIHRLPTLNSQLTSRAIKRTTTAIATLEVDTAGIVLELGDTQVEDGDSISLCLNGEWIATGFPVKKAVQAIPVRLKKGENILLFMADNLGSIPPNTARLRIRYGSKIHTLGLDTDLKKNNEIRLLLP